MVSETAAASSEAREISSRRPVSAQDRILALDALRALVALGAHVIGGPTGSLPMEPDWSELNDGLTLEPRGTNEKALPPSLSGTLVPLVTRGLSRGEELRFYAFMADEEV